MTHYDNSGSEDGQLRSPGDEQFISGDDDLEENDTDLLDIKPPQATAHYSRDANAREPKRREKLGKEKKHSKERRQHRERRDGGGGTASDDAAGAAGHERERERKAAGNTFREARTEFNDRYQQRGAGVGGGSYERNDGGGRYQKHYDRARDNHALMHQHHHNQQTAAMHMNRRQQDYFERPNDYHQQQHHHHHGNDYHNLARQAFNNKHYSQRVDYGHDMSEPVSASNMQREREREREREKERDRRKYSNSDGQDAESLEQDLRSRLLSKRHKYVKDYEPGTRKHHIELQSAQVYEAKERNERSYEEAHKERHSKAARRGKESHGSKVVIEVFDSPDVTDLTYEKTSSQQHNKKHKRREKDTSRLPEASEPTAINAIEKHRSPEDLELQARRAKLLTAEREKLKRNEQAREELQARRVKRRGERGAAEVIDELSPTAVAATVTAGLSAFVKRHKSDRTTEKRKKNKKHKSKQRSSSYEEGEHEEEQQETDEDNKNRAEYDDSEQSVELSESESEHIAKKSKRRKNSLQSAQHIKRKKLKNSKHKSDDDDEEPPTDEEDIQMVEEDEESNSNSDSDTASERSYKKSKAKRKHSKKSSDRERKHKSKKQQVAKKEEDDDDNDDVLKLPDSPLSIGELSKSPEKKHNKTKKNSDDDDEDDDDDNDDDDDADDVRSHSSRSGSRTESRSQSHSPQYSTHSSSRSRTRSRSRSRSSDGRQHSNSSSRTDSRSRSRSVRSRSRSSRSRSRTEERDMQANLRKSDAAELQQQLHDTADNRKNAVSPPPCDDKGVPLPNYFPGLQGCRSVEEFQCLNRIEEGTYGVVYRAKDKRTHEIVALKRLKMEKEKEGFPITSLREINTLLKGQHPNIVTVREIVVGSNMDKIFIVMDYVEHDLKSLMETMKTRKQCFLPGEVKCLTQQLLRAVGHLHDNWILHRDLKTSNLLLSHKGILKVGDFGLAREYGSPLKKYTSLVVTLWYRAPELLLCSPEYSTPIDIWSVGCIFAEFLQMAPLFPGKSEIDELNRIFKELGTPNDKIWPGYKDLPAVKNLLSQNSQFADYPVSNLRKRFHEKASETGIALLHGLLTYDPKQRLTADAALKHAYFKELPLPIDPSMFPTWPAKSELGARRALASSPKPPSGGSQFKQLGRDDPITTTTTKSATNKSKSSTTGFSGIITGNKKSSANTGFVLNAGIEQRQVAMGPGFNLKF